MNAAGSKPPLVSPGEATRLVLLDLPSPRRESVALDEALGRTLPGELPNLVDQPPFDKATMDGYAWRPREGDPAGSVAGRVFRVVGTVAAGRAAPIEPGPGECVRIMTGAPVPESASGVQSLERTSPVRDGESGTGDLVRFDSDEPAVNVARRGSNLRAGEPLLGPRILAPQDIGILASSGYARVEVSLPPVVGVLATGDEIVPARWPGTGGERPELAPGRIFDSNGPQLAAHVRSCGCVLRDLGRVGDDERLLGETLRRALGECDVVVVSGGVSMGDFDFIPPVLAGLGVRTVFHGIAVRPGKPVFYGRKGTASVFGLPGNPVSTFVAFEVFVRPHLEARMGLRLPPRTVRARLAAPLLRRQVDRVDFLPGVLSRDPGTGEPTVQALEYHGSTMLPVLATADCLLRLEIGVPGIEAGEAVDVRLLRA